MAARTLSPHMQLRREYDGLKPTYKRAEVAKGAKSKFYSVIKERRKSQGGPVMKKARGGKMSHVGLYPAEEKRSGTKSEAKRKQYAKKDKKKPKEDWKQGLSPVQIKEILGFPKEDPETGVIHSRKKKKKKKTKTAKAGGVIKKQRGGPFRQGYTAREDESLGMRTGPEAGKTQSLAARRDESYGDWGKRRRGRVNIKKGGSVRKMSEGGMLVASLYETIT